MGYFKIRDEKNDRAENYMRYADVFLPVPSEKAFTYEIPDDLSVTSGMRVKVKIYNRTVTGFVIRTHDNKPLTFEAKCISGVIDNDTVFGQKFIDLSIFVSDNYICGPGEFMEMAFPSGTRTGNRYKQPYEKNDYLFNLNPAQKKIYDDIIKHSSEGKNLNLLYGITGSGKTEIYIELAKETLRKNKSVIILVPEIALSSQIYQRLYNSFGDDLVLYHSNLSKNQRFANWVKFFKGDSKIAVGTRSGIFLQCSNLGLIIIDEEHDGSYKENSHPRYNARRIAFYRAKNEGALLLLGSATPSVESYYAADKGVLNLHKLLQRHNNAVLPEIEIIEIQSSKPESSLSPRLIVHTKEIIQKNLQAVYLLNRRGYSPVVMCPVCKEKAVCPNCSINLNMHNSNKLLCHYCGYEELHNSKCKHCGNDEMMLIGAGTQRIEEQIEKTFTGFRVMRLDQDSAGKKNVAEDLILKMNNGDIDLLLGTQMVAKGFDFKRIVLVGIIMADIGLNFPDFRATERVFSLLMQASGRCGRGDYPGKVFIQTLDSGNIIFELLKNHDYETFYKMEIEKRKELFYPPFSRIIRLVFRGLEESVVTKHAEKIAEILRNGISSDNVNNEIQILGPAPCPFSKIANNYRWHIILKSKKINGIKDIIKDFVSKQKNKNVYMEIDIDPVDIL